MKSSLASPSAGSPNSALPAYCAVVLATATRTGSAYVAVVRPSAAVARNVAVPAARPVMTPFWSMLASDGAVYVASRRPLRAGDIVTVKIERADAYDLHGVAV